MAAIFVLCVCYQLEQNPKIIKHGVFCLNSISSRPCKPFHVGAWCHKSIGKGERFCFYVSRPAIFLCKNSVLKQIGFIKRILLYFENGQLVQSHSLKISLNYIMLTSSKQIATAKVSTIQTRPGRLSLSFCDNYTILSYCIAK